MKEELNFNSTLTEAAVEEINEKAPIILVLKNTKGQKPSVIKKLNEDVTIRIVGGLDQTVNELFGKDVYYKRTLYSPTEVASIIEVFESIEEGINPGWSDLEKATYVYLQLVYNLKVLPDTKLAFDKNERDIGRNLMVLLNGQGISSGFAVVYKEAMDRLGIPCRYLNNPGIHSWNEILIDGEYYPLDLEQDIKDNQENIEIGVIELQHFLSDKEFYNDEVHRSSQISEKDRDKVRALDHSEIQNAMNVVLAGRGLKREKDDIVNKAVKETPKIQIKSKELKGIFEGDVISSTSAITSGIKINFSDNDTAQLNEDLKEIGQYYPEVLEKITLSNATSAPIDMQKTLDTIYQSQQDSLKTNGYLETSEIRIETSHAEDFDLDFSNAPEVIENPDFPTDDEKKKSTLAFINTSGTLKLPDLEGKISDNIDRLEFNNCNLSDFSIARNGTNNARNQLRRRRELVIKGSGSQGLGNIRDLDHVAYLEIESIPSSEFDAIMPRIIGDKNPNSPDSYADNLVELNIINQNLSRRDFLNEIKNKNIACLQVNSSHLTSINGIEGLKDQLSLLQLYDNDLDVNAIRRVCEIKNEKGEGLRLSLASNSGVRNQINNLTEISDDSYKYIDGLLRKTGGYYFRHYNYANKRGLEDSLLSWDNADTIPYYIEDAKLLREDLGYVCNPVMVKDLPELQTLIGDRNSAIYQEYMRDATLLLTKKQLYHLINLGTRLPQRLHDLNLKINLKINTVVELGEFELRRIESECRSVGINLTGVRILDDRELQGPNGIYRNIDCNWQQMSMYTVDEYCKIRTGLDEIIDGIDSNLPEDEKFAIVYKRLAKKAYHYDHEAAGGKPVSKNHAIYQQKKGNASRNLKDIFVESQSFDLQSDSENGNYSCHTVCSGYADALKSALALIGIESVIDHGWVRVKCSPDSNHPTDPTRIKREYEGGHAWNRVKINGKWYYADLCWDRGENSYGPNENNPNAIPQMRYALRGENTFCKYPPQGTLDGSFSGHYTSCPENLNDEEMEKDDYDQQRLKALFDKDHDYSITIPDNPDMTTVPAFDIDSIKDEYRRRKQDMYAKYYGDKDYQARYEEIAARYRANEVEATQGGITYRTVQDYAERADDEAFLLLGDYKNALERTTKYEAGDTSVYTGTQAEITAKYEKDKEYVETRNYTFDQNKNTQKDLATLGKYGETMPYIQRQQGFIKNVLRGVGNTLIFMRNIVAPVYRFIGRTVAQPLHRLRTRGRDASPYKNNPYHRFVARRDYFNDIAKQNDASRNVRHPFINMITSNIRAVTRYREGNEAVLNAGAYDIQSNLRDQEINRIANEFLNNKKAEIEQQITVLENEIQAHPNARNIAVAKNQLRQKRNFLNGINTNIAILNNSDNRDIQTDAISQQQHDVASKEFNTYKVTVIKGVAKIGAKKFVGPPLKKWLLAHAQKLVTYDVPYKEKIITRKFIEGTSETVPITEMQPDFDIGVKGLIEKAKGKVVKMYESVSGGNKGQISYSITGNETCTGLHFQNGTKWGTGFSNKVPLMTDQLWPKRFVDAAGNLRQNISFSEIAEAVSNGELSNDLLSKLTLQIGGKGWVYANELFDGATKSVKVGEKVISHAGHWEDVVEFVDKVKTVSEYVENPRVVRALDVLGKGATVGMAVDNVHNAGEVLRPTTSEERNNKSTHRQYNYNDSEFYR